jgi:acetyl-CoA carboxylase carboxyl transferase subunit alpha
MPDALEFEQPLLELETRIAALQAEGDPLRTHDEIGRLEERLARLRQRTYASLTAWQRTQLARHPKRPYTRDWCRLLFDDFTELHGDRRFGDDAAIVGGLARFAQRSIVVIGHQKGRDTREKIARNFGMPHPEGYRKAERLMEMAAKFRKPVVTFIDTPGAYPGLGAEERGQAEAIGQALLTMSRLRVPVVATVIGEGGSGGALGLGIANRVLMQEYATYSVITPEGCASILWRDGALAPKAAEQLRLLANDARELGVIDEVIEEPHGGAHRDADEAARLVKSVVASHLDALSALDGDALVEDRYAKFRAMGAFVAAR